MASADKQAARNRKILMARARGEDVHAIAARHDLSPTRVRQILAAGTAVLADVDDLDPVQIALERRAQYELLYEKALALFERIPDLNPSPKVGALRLAIGALDRLTAWDQAVGVIPGNLGWVYRDLDIRKFADSLWNSMESAGVPVSAIDQVIEGVNSSEEEETSTIEMDRSRRLPPPRG